MSSNTTSSYYPIDPELPQRDQYTATHTIQELDHSFANLIQAVNSTKETDQAVPADSRKRKRFSEESTTLSIANCTQPHSPKDPHTDREASPFLSSPSKVEQYATAELSSALFRRSHGRVPAKKYTRPPTKDVFQSLKIGTEEWVRLEALAKAFMLDDTHPERQASVGNRGSAPTNDTKIQLFKTVRMFLAEGAGTLYFGDGESHGAHEEDRWRYPRDEDRLIGLLTPLMRRMVTNERQRQYARRTRQSGVSGQSVEPETPHMQQHGIHDSVHPEQPSMQEALTSTPGPATSRAAATTRTTATLPAEPLFSNATEIIFLQNEQINHRQTIPSAPWHIPYAILLSTLRTQLLHHSQTNIDLANAIDTPIPPPDPTPTSTNDIPPYLDDEVRAAREAHQLAYEAHKAALQKAALAAAAQVLPEFVVECHGSDGLVRVETEEAWEEVGADVEGCVWMAGFLRMVVRICEG